MLLPGDSFELRKARGAFFTPLAIADHLTHWAINGKPDAKVLDPTCGEAVFLLSAGRQLKALGAQSNDLDEQLFGVDLHADSLGEAMRLLEVEDLDGHLITSDFFGVPTPDEGGPLPLVDAVVGNPPFVRYQEHIGESRRLSVAAALRQGVRLTGLASSWAATLVHAASFLKPDGRLAMVLPAELLTVSYAEPIRTWLRRRFDRVHLVMVERLQFEDAQEKVVLLLAEGTGGFDAFSLYGVDTAEDLAEIKAYDHRSITPPSKGKWTDFLVSREARAVLRRLAPEAFAPLSRYGTTGLGTVTGANKFFTLTEDTRRQYGLRESQLKRISPPGTKHLLGLTFGPKEWRQLRDAGERVWLLYPNASDQSDELLAYLALGEELGVDQAYKCQVRTPWWRPPVVPAPELFFTYMSHRYPRLIANTARASFVNSMHGIRLREDAPTAAQAALPLLCLNSVTMVGAEVTGRAYGGGLLKMEPREAMDLPLPSGPTMEAAWEELKPLAASLERKLRQGQWSEVCLAPGSVETRN
jgi:adenine-specific DNA-methyltransferase